MRSELLKYAVSAKHGKPIVSGDSQIKEILSAIEIITKCEAIAGLVLGKNILSKIDKVRDAMTKAHNPDAPAEAAMSVYREIRSIEIEIVEEAKNELMRLD